MKIDPSKKYTTRDGRPVTCLHRVPDGFKTKYPWRGIVDQEEVRWTDSGNFIEGGTRRHDLIEVREPMRLKMWIKDGHGPIFCPSDDGRAIGKMNELNYTLKEFVEVMP
jgi:hypothetical protein